MANKNILIVGDGELAFELVLYILENASDADIQVVSEEIDDRIEELREVCSNLSVLRKSFSTEDLQEQEIVFITLDDVLQTKKIATEAKKRNILVNAHLEPSLNDFHIKLQSSDEELTEIQKYTENEWKKVAFISIGLFFTLILGYVISLFISSEEIYSGVNWLANEIDEKFYWMIFIGFMAQLIDGLLGMGYGLTSTAALLSVGIPLPAISGSIHTAEMFSSGASGLSHYRFGNVNKKLLKLLIIPGVIGAVSGAILLSKLGEEYSSVIKPMLATYTLLLGIRIIYRVFKKSQEAKKLRNVGWLAFFGGFLDSFGGGGWGPLVTSTLISKGKTPRFVIGTVSLSEFFITFSSALTFFAFLGLTHWQAIVGLVLGGTLAAPLAARLAGKLPMRTMFICVGTLVILWSIHILVKTFLG